MSSLEPYPRVLHVIASLAIGGTERQLVGFVQRSSAPTQHHFALFDEPGPLAETVPNPPHVIGSVSRDFRSTGSNLRTVRSLRSLIRSLDVDLVHAHLDLSQILAALATPRSVAVVASRRGRNVGVMARPWLRPVEGLAHRRTAVLICNSEYLARRTRAHDLWPPPIEVINNAVDTGWFTAQPFPDGPPTVVMVANMHPYKRHDRFLRAFGIVSNYLADARAVLVGGGYDEDRVRRMIGELALTDRVTLAGVLDDLRPLYAKAHVVALASDHEGFPNVLLEGMATGRPVVSTSVGGIPELVRDHVDGLLVPPRVEAFADALGALMADRRLIERMGAEARNRAETFGWERLVRDTEALYRRVLERRGS
jgi:glycosyltransferase involved in cell wall biosynthesis